MKSRILVVGFPRSGTTLTYSIFKNHPEVGVFLFEKWLLNKCKTVEGAEKKHPFFRNQTKACGAKVIYAKQVIGKLGKSTQTVVDYCEKWNRFFGDQSRIVQIVRHPCDSLNSLVQSKKRLPRGPVFESVYEQYLKFIPDYTLQIAELPNVFTFKYEDLILNHKETLKKILEHCGLDTNYTYPKRIKTEKALNHQVHGNFLFKYNPRLKDAVEKFNRLPGIKYNLPKF
jgi:hypothetical protein